MLAKCLSHRDRKRDCPQGHDIHARGCCCCLHPLEDKHVAPVQNQLPHGLRVMSKRDAHERSAAGCATGFLDLDVQNAVEGHQFAVAARALSAKVGAGHVVLRRAMSPHHDEEGRARQKHDDADGDECSVAIAAPGEEEGVHASERRADRDHEEDGEETALGVISRDVVSGVNREIHGGRTHHLRNILGPWRVWNYHHSSHVQSLLDRLLQRSNTNTSNTTDTVVDTHETDNSHRQFVSIVTFAAPRVPRVHPMRALSQMHSSPIGLFTITNDLDQWQCR